MSSVRAAAEWSRGRLRVKSRVPTLPGYELGRQGGVVHATAGRDEHGPAERCRVSVRTGPVDWELLMVRLGDR